MTQTASPTLTSAPGFVGRGPSATAKGPRSRRRRVIRYVLVRLLILVPSLLAAATLTFFLVNLVPSDPVRALLGDLASDEAIAAKNAELGLDRPLLERYWTYLVGLFQGDLGSSYRSGESIASAMASRIPATLTLTVPGILLAAATGISLGVRQAASRRPGVVRALITVLQSMPSFVLGVLGILLLVSMLDLLPPPTGQLDVAITRPPTVTGSALIDALLAGQADAVVNALGHLVLPVVSLGLVLSVPFARITASSVASNLNAEFTSFTGGNGLRARTVVANARRASRASIIVVSGIVTAEIVGGTVIIERLFAWNGLGRWALDSILAKDLPAIQGFVLFSTGLTIVVYLVADVIGTLLDPRLR